MAGWLLTDVVVCDAGALVATERGARKSMIRHQRFVDPDDLELLFDDPATRGKPGLLVV